MASNSDETIRLRARAVGLYRQPFEDDKAFEARVTAAEAEARATVRAHVGSAGPTLHPSTFEYLKPTDEQIARMARVREAAAEFAAILDAELPAGPDKTFVLRAHRSNAMWANVAITRDADGSPRE